jgi:hypothetical protein
MIIKTRISVLWIALVLLVSGMAGCSKEKVQDAKEDFVMNLITSNLWKITLFTSGTEDYTSSFNVYDFKFDKDGTVSAMLGSTSVLAGTWAGSAENMTITSNFPTATSPLNKFNGVWKITKTTLSSVKSERYEGTVLLKCNLDKK